MKKIIKKGLRSKTKDRVRSSRELLGLNLEGESRITMIQMLIPLGLRAVEKELQSEVMRIGISR